MKLLSILITFLFISNLPAQNYGVTASETKASIKDKYPYAQWTDDMIAVFYKKITLSGIDLDYIAVFDGPKISQVTVTNTYSDKLFIDKDGYNAYMALINELGVKDNTELIFADTKQAEIYPTLDQCLPLINIGQLSFINKYSDSGGIGYIYQDGRLIISAVHLYN